MKLTMKNSHSSFYAFLCIFGGPFFLMSLLMGGKNMHQENPLAFFTAILFVLFMLFVCFKTIPMITISFSVTDEQIFFKRWTFLGPKEFVFNKDDISKLEITYGLIQKTAIQIHLKSSKIITVDLNYINFIDGALPKVSLSQYAPNDKRLETTLAVCVFISKRFGIPFFSNYLKNTQAGHS